MDEESPAHAPGDAWADLVTGVLDARTDEATRRFDADLAAALENGSVTEAAARRLRFWQRASVRGVAEHARAVLPATLRALEDARREALEYAEDGAESLGRSGTDSDSAFLDPNPAGSVKPQAAATGGSRDQKARSAAPAEAAPDARRASPVPTGQPRTLEERRPRLLVADLTKAQQERTS